MLLYVLLVLVVTTCIIVWVVDGFVAGRKRLRSAIAVAQSGGSSAEVEALVLEPMHIQAVKYLALFAGVAMLWRSIYVISDLNVILLIATLVLAVVYAVDHKLNRPLRQTLKAELAEAESEATAATGIAALAHETLVILAVILVLRAFIAEPFQIPSSSMKPTLEIGDFILVNKLPYGLRMPGTRQEIVDFGDPQRGDVIVFRPPHEPNTSYIKRVIAVPGDHIRYDFVSKRVWVNSELLPITEKEMTISDDMPVRRYLETIDGQEHELYQVEADRRMSYEQVAKSLLNTEFSATFIPKEGIVVPEGKYFVMGDNRDNSLDSRFWGFVDEDQISGKAVFVWMHWPSLFSIPNFKNFGGIE